MGIFTGLITEVGNVSRAERRADGASLVIQAKAVLDGTQIGDSISINGVDLTVIEMGPNYFRADASLETLRRSTLGGFRVGSLVNLERALALGERLGGHIVQGHVDGIGGLASVTSEGNAYRMRFRFPRELGRYIAVKGSIALDGTSLTVAGLDEECFEVVIIPHTWKETTLRYLRPGDPVNLEVDVLAKYVERLIENKAETKTRESKLTVEYLTERGY